MRIDVLTVSCCPHRGLAMTRLRQAIDRSGVVAAVVELVIDDQVEAAKAGMVGSPTILLDGRNVFDVPGLEPSISCRLYHAENRLEGAPSVGALIDALTSAEARP